MNWPLWEYGRCLKTFAGFQDILKNGKPFPIPKFKILDVGCGFGKWGFLIRDTIEVMIGQNFNKKDWKIEITGVEVFPKCITNLQELIYDKIIKKDVFECFDELDKYDLIIMGDVVEHFEKDKAHELINKMFEFSNDIIISTPHGFMPQGEWAGNIYERHRSGWKLKDFKQYKVVEHKIVKSPFLKNLVKDIGKKSGSNLLRLYSKIINPKLLVLWIRK